MRLIRLRDPARIEAYCRQDAPLHLYELGDLDPFFWTQTRWLGVQAPSGALEALALLYAGPQVTTLLALGRGDPAPLRRLLEQAIDAGELPARIHAHLSPGLREVLAPGWHAEPPVPSHKMALTRSERLDHQSGEDVRRLTPADHGAVTRLLAEAYPDNWYDGRMLETGMYVGVWDGTDLQAVAGVHVYSPATRVAALGNIATRPDARRRGLAARATAALCRRLLETVDTVGLNVHAENTAAIHCYRRLGFTEVAPYEEVGLTARDAS